LGATFAIAVGIGVGSGLGGLAVSQYYRIAAGGAITLLAAAALFFSWLFAPTMAYCAEQQWRWSNSAAGMVLT
jgi:ABC-type Mn2+/Zn2+ transport system permease subunit